MNAHPLMIPAKPSDVLLVITLLGQKIFLTQVSPQRQCFPVEAINSFKSLREILQVTK